MGPFGSAGMFHFAGMVFNEVYEGSRMKVVKRHALPVISIRDVIYKHDDNS